MTKGKRRERQAADIYRLAGYETQPFRGTRYAEKDGFGLFDFVALPTPDTSAETPRFVQVKSNRATGIENWSREVVDRFRGGGFHPDFLVCYDGQGGHNPTPQRWRLLEPVPKSDGVGHRALVDEREDVEPLADGEAVVEYLKG